MCLGVSGFPQPEFLRRHGETPRELSCSRSHPKPFARKSPSMNFKSSTALIAALVLPLSVMAQNVATVNGKAVPMSRLDALIKTATRGGQQEVPPEVKAQAKDQVVLREIFAQ